MLYNSGKHELAKPRKLSFREIRDIAQKEFNELYPYACGLLEGVKEYYLPKKQTKISAFLLHQVFRLLPQPYPLQCALLSSVQACT